MRAMRLFSRAVILIVWFGLFRGESSAQKKIIVDFQNRLILNPDILNDLKRGAFYVVEVDSINLNLFRVTVGKTDTTTARALPAITFSTLGIADVTSIVNALSPTGGIVSSLAKQLDLRSQREQVRFSENARIFLTQIKSTDSTAAPVKKIVDEEKANTKKEINAVSSYVDSQQVFVRASCDSLRQIQESVQDLIFRYNKVAVASTLDFPQRNAIKLNKLSIGKLYDQLGHSSGRLDTLYWRIRREEISYEKRMNPYLADLKTKTIFKTLSQAHDSVVRASDNLTKLVSAARDTLLSNNTLTYVKTLATLSSSGGTTFKSLPLQFNGDAQTINISISPQLNSSSLQSYTTQIIFPSQKDEFWGVSSGFYFGCMKNNAFSFKQTVNSGADTVFVLQDEKAAYVEFGLNAMLRYGHTLFGSDSWYLQAGIGPGLAISDKVRPRMLLGIGLAYGSKEHKLLLDFAGEVFGFSNYLSNTYAVGEEFKTAPTGGVTVSKMRNALSVSLSYLFY